MLSPWSWLRPVSWSMSCSIRWPAHQIHQRSRAGVVALAVVAVGALVGAVLDAAALICSHGDGCGQFHQRSRAGAAASWPVSSPVPAPCLMRWPAHQIHRQGRAVAVALVVIAVGALVGAGVVLDVLASSTRSTSEGGSVPSPWSWPVPVS